MSDKPIKPSMQLKLRRKKDKHGKKRWMLKHGAFLQDGKLSWDKTEWVVRPDSFLPTRFFYKIVNAISYQVRHKVPKSQKSFSSLHPQIRKALCSAATNCGCKFKQNEYDGYTWSLKGDPFMDFTILDFSELQDGNIYKGKRILDLGEKIRKSHSRPQLRRMERKSKAMFRVAIAVMNKGILPKFVPGRTREDHHG
jgi:hypothetical protein